MRNLSLPSAQTGELLPVNSIPGMQPPSYAFARPVPGSPLAYLEFIRRHKWALVLWAVLGVSLGLLISFVEPRMYEAKATLEVQDVNEDFLNMKQVMPVNEVGLAGTFNDMQTQIKIIQSDSVLDPVIAKMPARAAQLSLKTETTPERVKRLVALPESGQKFSLDDAKKLAATMKVRAVGQTRVIEITADSSNPRLAAEFINQLCAEYIDQNMKSRWAMSQRTAQSLSGLLDQDKEKLRASEDALQDYARSSGLMITSDKKNVADDKLSELQDELSKAQDDRIAAQSRYEMAKNSAPDGLPDELSQGLLRQYQSKLTDLRQQRAELAATYTGDYGKIRRLDSEITAVQAAIQQEQQSVVERTQNEYFAAIRREKMLTSQYQEQTGVVTDLGQRSVQYNILEHDVESNQQAYDELLKEVKEASVASAVGTSNVRILDPAQPPHDPYSPNPLLSCALGVTICMFLGIALGFTRDVTDPSLREPGEGLQYLGLAEMGVMIRDSSGFGLLHSPGPHGPDLLAAASPLGTQDLGKSPHEAARRISDWFTNPGKERLLALESCRAVVTSLISASNGATQRLLVVTSPGPGEGKTTVVANLGLTLALIGWRVLLIDGDIRRRRLHAYFDLGNERGLTTLLQNGPVSVQTLNACVQKTVIPGLSVLTSGPAAAANSGLLYSPELAKLLVRLREEYDFVLIDTPPVFPVADARVLGRLSDGVILVARAGHTARVAAAAAHRRLAADDIRVLGLILNDWDPETSAHTYYAEYTKEYADSYSE
jgi:polysaccharide biosynthesis transport protein